MKTIMKISKTGTLLMAIFFLAIGCSSDDGNETAVDPRAVFVGEYETEDYDLSFSVLGTSQDTTIVAKGGVDIEISLVENDKEEIQIEGLDEFLKAGFQDVVIALGSMQNVAVTTDPEAIAKVGGDEFDLGETVFTLTASDNNGSQSAPVSLSGQGDLDGNSLLFKFEYSYSASGQTVILSGEVEMEKEE